MAEPVVEFVKVCKTFGLNTVLSDVDFSVAPGQVACLLGDNGAGKSTLIKILSGVHTVTRGELRVDGEAVDFRSPRDAQARGITTVFQEIDTFPLMSIAQNFFIGREPMKGFGPLRWIDHRAAASVARTEIKNIGIRGVADASQLVGTLSGGERQALAIGRALYFGAKVLILDEPTSALGVKEAAVVLRLIRKARDGGVAIIFITHNAHHALTVGDSFTVLKQGKVLDQFRAGERTRLEVITLMAGGEEIDMDGQDPAEIE
ncbi:MAG: ATP-binding cassette domain-containing protein [Bifidobacteriaceae bacterium]|jgi:simple sugar transport system ATP-binding protein|nr:ATP-binding cassette domain-containing protein [Bifidobacteriaceae bacterium]